ncbi:uncharacterized protein K452DRAFT_155177 [Aplosporella prunicola CBS 121167]|uniref:Uncharacterized protein n=1 Tax=Aplosporella prunicola CBS 121167 TaxID=1176127 RepID=A0A6A6BNU4_9PEZI|nr:uncharacterized protein K452DRAFT_155177 [Aplosporella prunicola CBS 121167]KAF2144231.1 hypothetical protein K452DRAFT_155177 [Aplosporella prunicola CBS 121167]
MLQKATEASKSSFTMQKPTHNPSRTPTTPTHVLTQTYPLTTPGKNTYISTFSQQRQQQERQQHRTVLRGIKAHGVLSKKSSPCMGAVDSVMRLVEDDVLGGLGLGAVVG